MTRVPLVTATTLAAALVAIAVGTSAEARGGQSASLDLYRQTGMRGQSLAIDRDQPRMHFAARSLRASGRWSLCPRPFFGGTCIEVDGEVDDLRLPRGFSGAVRSVKLLAAPEDRLPARPGVERPAEPKPPEKPVPPS
jgi:hypothetical protein